MSRAGVGRILLFHARKSKFRFCDIHSRIRPYTVIANAAVTRSFVHKIQQRYYRQTKSRGRDDEYYVVLGIDRAATPAEIKKAYFAQAKLYHPDQNQGSDEAKKKFQKITEAYEVLRDVEKRQLYDQFGKAAVDGSGPQGGPFEGGFGGGFAGDPFGGFSGMYGQRIHVDPQDIFGAFEQMFGNGGFQQRSKGPKKGQDLQIGLNISFLESVFGVKRNVNVTYKGKGKQGRKTKQVMVDIPAGVQDGMAFQIRGEGAEGDKGAPMGDLLVQISVADDPYFTRDGIDVHVETTISFAQAVLGGKVDVLTLDGMVELTIPPGTSPETVLMMRHKGIKRLQGFGKGDQYVHVKVEVPNPSQLSKEQKQLVEQMRELETGTLKPQGAFASFAEKIQSALSRLTRHSQKTKDDDADKKSASREADKGSTKENSKDEKNSFVDESAPIEEELKKNV